MRISDWSSDVCSSDLAGLDAHSLVKLIGTAGPGALFNNACQLWNHNFFWQCLSPDVQEPSGELAKLIVDGFGSTAAMLKAFRSEESRVGKECVSTCRSRWSQSL